MRDHASPSHSLPRDQADEDDESDDPQRSCDLDDDDEKLSISQELRNAPMLSHYVLLKIPKNDGIGDLGKHLNRYKTHMSLRGATRSMKCRVFNLTLSSIVELWYNMLFPRSISS